MRAPGRARSLLVGAAGVVVVVLLWWLLALTLLADARVPTPGGVVASVLDDGWAYYGPNFSMTVEEALVGFVYGNVAAIALASFVLLVPQLESVIMQLAVISYCIPIVAIAPVLYIVIGIPEDGAPSGTAVALATLSVFFTTVVGTVLGLRSAERTSLDVVSVYGGGRWAQLRKVQLVSALPSILNALQIAAPAAFLGAILGEYAGGLRPGVARVLVTAQQNLDVERAWATGLLCALVAGLGYAAFGLLGRVVSPWSKGVAA
ncbi:ABC transporter permease subunit [Nocardioides sp. ChNu-153]|uniref:ABC transporter permease n=1 Tax=unclassified Nocardioides TaxID=2615069 RepID=UPI00240565C0|nr:MULTISPECIES: ABC transporter permease subunit [unclassified Nocardioides]MDN7120186.1 ABC transporter permease subunit [Nocardioides sp. ChNu-153]